MSKSKKIIEDNSLYMSKISDDQIIEYVCNELGQHLPNKDFPIKLMKHDGNFFSSIMKKENVYYVRIGEVKREGGKAHILVTVDYMILKNGRWPQTKGYNLDLEISDFDCVNRTTKDGFSHPNETWVDYVNSIVKDKEYMVRAQKYMHETYPQYYARKAQGGVVHGWDRGITTEKPRLEL